MKDLHPQVKKIIILIGLLILLIITLLSFFGQAGVFGNYYKSGLDSLMGHGLWLVPLILILLIWKRKIIFRIGLVLLILGFLGLLELFKLKGGYLGLAASYFLLEYAGFWVSLIFLIALIIIAVLIIVNIPIFEFIKKKEKIVEKVERIITKRKPEQEEKIKTEQSKAWQKPSIEFLETAKDSSVSAGNIENNKKVIQKTLENFAIEVEMGNVHIGPTVTQYTFRPALGVKLSKITALQNDLSLALAAHPLRLEAPIPGKSLVGIEVPNQKIAIVRLRELLQNDMFQKSPDLTIALGKDVAGNPIYSNLAKMPHLLISGSTGSGKTICINAVILSLLFKHSPKQLKLLLIDPKRVELTIYDGIPHLLGSVITEHKKAIEALKWATKEMEDRFKKLQTAGARDIQSYKGDDMPYLVIVIDELADLMASHGRDVEAAIVRLAQMARAVGIHLIVSTQRPSIEVITGLIKANITSRIAFQVATQVDSRTILDMAGAEKLLGNGDMLFLSGDSAKPRRIQGALVTDNETKKVIKELKKEEPESDFQIIQEKSVSEPKTKIDPDDDLYEDAKELVIRSKRASASMLQRHLRVGYARAARLLDLLEANGIVGPHQGAKPRQVNVRDNT